MFVRKKMRDPDSASHDRNFDTHATTREVVHKKTKINFGFVHYIIQARIIKPKRPK